jgi:hypothetical protein
MLLENEMELVDELVYGWIGIIFEITCLLIGVQQRAFWVSCP